jgi:signal transduction histidine kinase/ActR/RegA family two-component response regulator
MTSKNLAAIETQRRIEELFYDLKMDFPADGEFKEQPSLIPMSPMLEPTDPTTAQPVRITWDNLQQSLPEVERRSETQPVSEYRPPGVEMGEGMEDLPITSEKLLKIVADDVQQHWGEDELKLVEQVSDQLSQALENARLFNETQQARDALQVSVRYQKSIAEAMAQLNERGFTAITEVLQILGEASQTQRVCYFETQQDQQGPYFRLVSEWHAPDIASQMANQILRHFTAEWIKSWLNRLEKEGSQPQMIGADGGEGQDLLDILGGCSLLQLPIVFERGLPGWLGFVQVDHDRCWTPEEISALQTTASGLTNTIVRENLFNQLQFNLSETEAQYQASAQLNSANEASEILTILRKFTILGHMNVSFASISLFDAPWARTKRPQWLTQTAQWTPSNITSPFGERFDLRYWKNLNQLFTQDHPTIIFDIASEIRLDQALRQLFVERLGAKSMLAVPLNVSGRWIGLIISFFNQITGFSESEIRHLVSLSQQAAIAVQSLRLLDESRRRAGYLQTAAEIARDTTGTLAIEELFSRTVNLIKERFGFYHASIFLIDEATQMAVVRESTGIAGEAMKLAGHSLSVGGQSIVGKATGTGKAVVLNDVNEEQARKTHRPNPLLPNTQAELGIPLIIGDHVIGALDVQSEVANSFTEDEIAVLQTLADQIAIAVENAQSYGLAQKAIEEIRDLDRLKTQFLANMSHELRTPLNSIIGFSRIILKGIDGPVNSQQMQDLTAIYNSGQHLLGLINDVLDVSRIEAGKMDLAFEETNLVEIIKGVMSTTVGLVNDKPIELKLVIDPELPLIIADATKIRQVLINLLSNAAKFTARGSITIQAMRREGKDGELQVTVRVIDTGPGIAKKDQEKLFQPFSQVDGSLTRKTGGSGLGLSICRHLIQMHHGEIGIESEEGKGSTFYFIIPVKQPEFNRSPADAQTTLASSETATAVEKPENLDSAELQLTSAPKPGGSQEAQAESQAAGAPQLILAIDSDHQVIDLYRRYLSGIGCSVISLTRLDQAVEAARGLQPHVITLDLAMKDAEQPSDAGDQAAGKPAEANRPLDGLKILERLKKDPTTRHIPIVICSILNMRDEAFELGAAEYLLKPILEEDLIQAIQRIQADDKG